MYKIGILEDDMTMGRELVAFLGSNGYEARFIEPSEYAGIPEASMTDLLLRENIALLLLDIGLPGFDGVRLCKAFRARSRCPVIMITSDNSELTELMSIQNGADDFIPKPFNTRILLARMEGVLRRAYQTDGHTGMVTVALDDGSLFVLDSLKGRIENSSGDQTELSKNELQILSILISKKGEIVSRDEIMEYLWDNQAFVDDNTLTVNMTRLKGKLEQIGIMNAVRTRRGMGYVLN